jgi:hypothetical protein
MVHFPGFARTRLWIHRAVIRFYRIGFPHSEIPGSMPTCGSPRLIAACHVLHRLLLPRHPPCALSSLTIKFTQPTSTLRSIRARKIYGALLCSSLPTVIADREAPAESKALIKFTTTRLVVTQCYSVVKNHCALRRPTLERVELLSTQCSMPSNSLTTIALTSNIKLKAYWPVGKVGITTTPRPSSTPRKPRRILRLQDDCRGPNSHFAAAPNPNRTLSLQ